MPSDHRPPLTDRPALRRHRARARAHKAPALFLHQDALDEIQERLAEVNRTFTRPAIVTGQPDFWRRAFPDAKVVEDTDTLDLDRGAHDLVIHALALHWANDPVGQLIQSRRALCPDGLFLGLTYGGQSLQELRQCLGSAEAELRGGLSPRVAPMGEIRDLGALLQRAGFALPVADSWRRDVLYPSPLGLMWDLRAMGETNALTGRTRSFTPRAVMLRAIELYALTFARPDGRIAATAEIIALTGWAPAEDQPKPLRPGSAAARLADALNTDEVKLPGDGSD
ncbi:methyltransferase domain-containing protein [Fluviibacterium sp. DFM31]|uniref:Methyltransferase domain-containing protein n=1 Tax=Meridianimarinicoccus marinus TaxID=3231483 RepID=A0ABV3L8Z4_9RHOB